MHNVSRFAISTALKGTINTSFPGARVYGHLLLIGIFFTFYKDIVTGYSFLFVRD